MVGIGLCFMSIIPRDINELSDDNRQLLLAANFPQSVVSLLQRYSAIQVEPLSPLPVSLMELKILKTTAGVILNTSLFFGTSDRTLQLLFVSRRFFGRSNTRLLRRSEGSRDTFLSSNTSLSPMLLGCHRF